MRTLKDRLRKQANKPKLKKPAPMTFQVELKSWRTGCELTQDAAATYLNVSVRTYQEWEQGRANPKTIGPVRILMKLYGKM